MAQHHARGTCRRTRRHRLGEAQAKRTILTIHIGGGDGHTITARERVEHAVLVGFRLDFRGDVLGRRLETVLESHRARVRHTANQRRYGDLRSGMLTTQARGLGLISSLGRPRNACTVQELPQKTRDRLHHEYAVVLSAESAKLFWPIGPN